MRRTAIQPLRQKWKDFRAKSTSEKTEPGSIRDDITSSKDGDTIGTTATGSDVKSTEPQAEGDQASIPTQGQALQTPDVASTEIVEDSTDPEAATAETRETEGAPVSSAPEAASVKSPEQVASTLWDEAYDTLKVEPEAESVKSPEQVTSNLWDEAYDTLKVEDPDRLDHYERILTLWLQGGPRKLTPRRPSMSKPSDNIVPSDPRERGEQLSKIIVSWLSNTAEDGSSGDGNREDESSEDESSEDESSEDESSEDESSEDESSEDESSEDESSEDEGSDTDTKWLNIFHLLLEIMRSTARSIPDTALLWVGACLSVQSLSSPAFRSEAVISGIGHVISRMAWYNVLPKLLANDGNYTAPRGGDFIEEQQLLRNRIIGLYKAILSYQIEVVCSQSIHLRGRASAEPNQALPSPSGILSEAEVVDAEKALACFRGLHIESQTRRLVEALNHERLNAIRDREQTTKKALSLLKDLNAIDTQQSISGLISQKRTTLKPLYEWICSTPEYVKFDKGDARVLWVSGAAGTGTTMLMLAIIQGLSLQTPDSPDSSLFSYSFCSNGQHRPENAASVVKSLIYLVLQHQPWLIHHLAKKCKSTDRKDFSDVNDFYALSLVLYDMIQDERFKSTLFLIDGIDECVVEGLDSFLSLITTTTRLSSRVRWLASICSTKSDIVSTSLGMVIQSHLNLDSEYVKVREIFEKYYIPSKVDELSQHGHYEGEFRADVTAKLLRSSFWNFLWADIACDAIIKDDSWHALDNLDIPVYIEPLYLHMKRKIAGLGQQDREYCFRVLLTMAIAFRPLNITELEAVVDLPPKIDLRILVQKRCFAFLELCDGTVYFTHHSARDFVRQDMRSSISHAHSGVVQRCLLSLSKSWGKSATDSHSKKGGDLMTSTDYAAVYWIRHLYDAEGIEEDDVIQFLTGHPLEWLDLLASKGQLSQACELMRELETVLKERLNTRPGNGNPSRAQDFIRLVRETHRLLRFHQSTKSPNEVRAKNSLLFCPSNSTTRQRLLPSEFPELAAPPVMEQSWSRVVHVLEGHSDYVRCCAYSHDGKLLASASDDGSVRIWDTTTGRAQHVFEEFRGWVYLVAFSSKGLLAASDRATIKIWDVATGLRERPPDDVDLYVDHSGTVGDVNFSDDGSMLVAVDGQRVTIWKLPSFSVIVQQAPSFLIEDFTHARFSGDGTLLGTVSANQVTVWKLDNETENEAGDGAEKWAGNQVGNQLGNQAVNEATDKAAEEPETIVKRGREYRKLRKLREFQVQGENGSERASGVTFSPDSKYVATGMKYGTSGRNTVHIWELGSDNLPRILSGHTDDINSVSFSPDGSLLASVSDDKTTRIWKAPWNGEAKQPALILREHSRAVIGLSFSPTWQKHLATCSSDETLRIWEYDSYEAETEPETSIRADDEIDRQAQPYTRAICFVASSKDGKLVASASMDGLMRLWDGDSGAVLRDLQGHEGYIRSLVFSCDSKRLVSASDDGTIRIWDTTGKVEGRALYGHTDWVRSAMLSHDGRLVVSGSDDRTVRVWNITRRDVGERRNGEKGEAEEKEDTDGIRVLEGHTGFVISVTCSDNGQYVAAGGDDGNVLLWELSMDQPSALLKHKTMKDSHHHTVYAVVFVPDASKVIASSHETIRIWNTKTCQLIRKVKEDRSIYTLQVNLAFPRYLFTEFGPILMEDSTQTKPTAQCPYSGTSFSSESWITWKETKVIFLPKQYRPTPGTASVRVHGDHVVIGCSSGQILFFRFKRL